MKCRAAFAGLRTLLTGLDGRDAVVYSQPISEAVCWPVPVAEIPQMPDGLALLNQRAWAIHQARQAKPHSEARGRFISRAYSITHDILKRGPTCLKP